MESRHRRFHTNYGGTMKGIGIAEIMKLMASYGIIYDNIGGYFVGNKYTKVKVDDNIIVINNIYWDVKSIERLNI